MPQQLTPRLRSRKRRMYPPLTDQWVTVTAPQLSNGLYPGEAWIYNAPGTTLSAGAIWTPVGQVYIDPPNGEVPTQFLRYLARRMGTYSDGTPVMCPYINDCVNICGQLAVGGGSSNGGSSQGPGSSGGTTGTYGTNCYSMYQEWIGDQTSGVVINGSTTTLTTGVGYTTPASAMLIMWISFDMIWTSPGYVVPQWSITCNGTPLVQDLYVPYNTVIANAYNFWVFHLPVPLANNATIVVTAISPTIAALMTTTGTAFTLGFCWFTGASQYRCHRSVTNSGANKASCQTGSFPSASFTTSLQSFIFAVTSILAPSCNGPLQIVFPAQGSGGTIFTPPGSGALSWPAGGECNVPPGYVYGYAVPKNRDWNFGMASYV